MWAYFIEIYSKYDIYFASKIEKKSTLSSAWYLQCLCTVMIHPRKSGNHVIFYLYDYNLWLQVRLKCSDGSNHTKRVQLIKECRCSSCSRHWELENPPADVADEGTSIQTSRWAGWAMAICYNYIPINSLISDRMIQIYATDETWTKRKRWYRRDFYRRGVGVCGRRQYIYIIFLSIIDYGYAYVFKYKVENTLIRDSSFMYNYKCIVITWIFRFWTLSTWLGWLTRKTFGFEVLIIRRWVLNKTNTYCTCKYMLSK